MLYPAYRTIATVGAVSPALGPQNLRRPQDQERGGHVACLEQGDRDEQPAGGPCSNGRTTIRTGAARLWVGRVRWRTAYTIAAAASRPGTTETRIAWPGPR